MNTCIKCGAGKPADATVCPACEQVDEEVLQRVMMGTPGLTLLMVSAIAFWAYRFWYLGWAAWGGNLRILAIAGVVLGLTSLVQPLWGFGIRSRKVAGIVSVLSIAAFLVFNAI